MGSTYGIGPQRVEVGELGRDVVEALSGEPAPVSVLPGAAAAVDPPVANPQLRDAVPQPGEIGTDLLAWASEITDASDSLTAYSDHNRIYAECAERDCAAVIPLRRGQKERESSPPRRSDEWRSLYRRRCAVEREFGRLKPATASPSSASVESNGYGSELT